MIKADLITGFLGSGKTTFLKKYVEYLVRSGEKIGVLENDYGAVNVDMMLLSDLAELGAELETVAGACDFDCHKRRFKTKLIALGMSGLTRVVIEPSGIFDSDEFFDSLREDPLERLYEIGSVITVIDPAENSFSELSDYILASQAACAGTVVFSKTQLRSEKDIRDTVSKINKTLGDNNCPRRLDSFIAKSWDDLTDADMKLIENSGWHPADMIKRHIPEDCFGSVYFMNRSFSVKSASALAKRLLSDDSFGSVRRVKGFINENGWLEFNATASELTISPIKNGQDIIIVIGERLDEEKIRRAAEL